MDAESHYGRADAPAIAVVRPAAVRPRPARWVAARPDHGAAPIRARAGGCRQRKSRYSVRFWASRTLNRHRRMTESDPFRKSRFADERFSNRHESEHRNVSRWPSVPSGDRLSLSVAASVCVFSLCFKKRQVLIDQFGPMYGRVMASDNRIESEVECF